MEDEGDLCLPRAADPPTHYIRDLILGPRRLRISGGLKLCGGKCLVGVGGQRSE